MLDICDFDLLEFKYVLIKDFFCIVELEVKECSLELEDEIVVIDFQFIILEGLCNDCYQVFNCLEEVVEVVSYYCGLLEGVV